MGEPEKKEAVNLKKTEPQPKKEEEKKVETPALKPTPKTEKEPQEESKETVELKPVKKEVSKNFLLDKFCSYICCRKRLQTFLFKLQIFFQTKQFKISTQNTALHHNAVKKFAFQML